MEFKVPYNRVPLLAQVYCVPSLNEIRESIFDLSRTQVKMYGSLMEVKPVYPQFLSGGKKEISRIILTDMVLHMDHILTFLN